MGPYGLTGAPKIQNGGRGTREILFCFCYCIYLSYSAVPACLSSDLTWLPSFCLFGNLDDGLDIKFEFRIGLDWTWTGLDETSIDGELYAKAKAKNIQLEQTLPLTTLSPIRFCFASVSAFLRNLSIYSTCPLIH